MSCQAAPGFEQGAVRSKGELSPRANVTDKENIVFRFYKSVQGTVGQIRQFYFMT